MSLFESTTGWLLGRRVAPPPELPDGLVPPEVVLREGRLVPWLGGLFARMGAPAAAVTLGRTIVLNPRVRLTPRLLAHELAHVRQWRADLLFPLRYTVATFRYGYLDNPYEVEAREAEAYAGAAPRSERAT